MRGICMFKNIMVLILAFYATCSFAISPGAGQAQIRNNQQVQKENQQRMEQFRKEQMRKKQHIIHEQTTPKKNNFNN
jgi:hypothetical protein